MAEIEKLSVGKVLDKLRRADASSSKCRRLDELDDEIQRLRAQNRRLERDQRAASTARGAPEVENPERATTWLKIVGITIGIAILIPLLAWSCGLS
jgi:hypothetical protein